MNEINAAVLTVETETDGERKTSRFDCEYIVRDGGFEVRYTDGSGDETKLRFTENGLYGFQRAEIERSGSSSGLIVIEPMRGTPCCMHTPQGRLDLIIGGKNVMIKYGDTVGWAEFAYTVKLGDGSSEISCRLCAKVKE